MSIYTFNTNLLSAQKTGIPNFANTSISATGVVFLSGNNVVVTTKDVGVVSLSTTDIGLAFTPVNFSIGSTVHTVSGFSISDFPTVTVNVLGSVFNIPCLLHNNTLALIDTGAQNYSVFTWLSSTTTVPLSDITENLSRNDVSSPETRRLRMLGYF